MNSRSKWYEVVRNQPVARFYYQGSHSHPVRRTIVVTRSHRRYIEGYELREGSITRDISEAPIKKYRRDRIATADKLGARKHREPGKRVTTLVREPLFNLLRTGA